MINYKKIAICVGGVILSMLMYLIAKDKIDRIFHYAENEDMCVFQIDEYREDGEKLVLEGFCLQIYEDAEQNEYDIILYNEDNGEGYHGDIDTVYRDDVNTYFSDGNLDYSYSGYIASWDVDDLNLQEDSYKVLVRYKNGTRKAYFTGVYLVKGNVAYVDLGKEGIVPPKTNNDILDKVVNEGILQVYIADKGIYLYQYDWSLYWIIDKAYEFELDGMTFFDCQIQTSQISRLPKHRLDSDLTWDNKGFNFESNEDETLFSSEYRVVKRDLPCEYSVTGITVGYFINDWVWKDSFRPFYKFD